MEKIYISLPLGGHEETARKRYDDAVEWVKKNYPNAEIYGPTNMDEFEPDVGLAAEREHDWAWYMGEDMKILLRCTHIVMTRGWSWSPGCRVERAAAIANKIIVDQVPDANKKLD